MRISSVLSALSVALFTAMPAQAAFDLQITEIWSGQDGPDITADWTEIHNYGDMAWTAAIDGDLFIEDESGNNGISGAILVQGILSIGPGETAIILHEDDTKTTFFDAWNPAKTQNLDLIGFADGSGIGLGGGGDSVYLFLAGGALLDSESYPDTGDSPLETESWDVNAGDWSFVGDTAGSVESFATAGDSGLVPAVASPGMVAPAIPEPTSLLVFVGLVAAAASQRKRAC
jgi:hypothetical protein